MRTTSGASVRTILIYDGTGLLKPAHKACMGTGNYDEPQSLKLQQILLGLSSPFPMDSGCGGIG